MYAHVCLCVSVFKALSGDFPVPSCCHRVWHWSCFPRCSHHPVSLSHSLSLTFAYSLNFHFQGWETHFFKLSISCCLLPLSNASITAAQIPTPSLDWLRERFSLQTRIRIKKTGALNLKMQYWILDINFLNHSLNEERWSYAVVH